MKILWVINIMLPEIAAKLGRTATVREGWLSGAFSHFSKETGNTFAVAYPVIDENIPVEVEVNNIKCYSFSENLNTPEIYDSSIEQSLKSIIEKVKPDILHIFGTEFPHALAAVRAFNNKERTLIGIQGLCREIAADYFALIPEKTANSRTIRDIIRKDSLKEQKEKFERRAENEALAIRGAGHITGRTAFDEKGTLEINSLRVYHYMNETMRAPFYEDRWEIDNTEPCSIFTGQGDYPIKGLHFLIQAAGMLARDYPELKIYVAGNDIIYKSFIKLPQYGKYLRKLIRENSLEGKVVSLGQLSAREMKERYLKSAVFVCPSYVENSPNTLAEAMLLGLPVIASDAGGIPSMISEKEGLLFERGNAASLAEAIRVVFKAEGENQGTLKAMCDNAYGRAHKAHDGQSNLRRLFEIYNEIVNTV